MFAKENRVSKRDFSVFFKTARRYHSPALQLLYVPNEQLKVAVVVPKKSIKSAVGRNRLRRVLYHQLRPLLTKRTGVYIFICKASITATTVSEIVAQLKLLVGLVDKAR